MPLLLPARNCPSDGSPRLLFWHTTETEAELLSLLPPQADYGAQSAALGASRRRREEWLTVRVLLHEALGPDARIAYFPTRRPYLLESSLHLSVSHTHGYVAIALADYPLGMDIELWSPRALRLTPHFLLPDERNLLPPDPEREAVMLWSAKETAYKYFDIPGLSLTTGIALRAASPRRGTGNVRLTATAVPAKQRVSLAAEYLEKFVLTYTLPPA